MIYSIVSLQDIFYNPSSFSNPVNSLRSSNPYDYIRQGYFLDNAALYGGKNYVDYKGNITSNRTSNCLGNTNI